MIAVISDLHFEEEAADIISGHGRSRDLVFRRKLDPRAYRHFIAQMAEEVEKREVKEFNLVIAGDLFDFNRTTLWFNDELRPYVPLDEIDAALEAKILHVLEAIAKEQPVKEALETFRLFAQGRYRANEAEGGTERDFPAKRLAVHHITSNHDRLSNATPAVRRRVRELIGLKGDKSFPHY